jgi:large subunit ribosomal protein L15
MNLLSKLAPKIAKKAKMRKGQGNGTKGTFAGRGKNGQNCRAGGGVRPGFEGGQSGLLMRMPKLRGFKNPNRVEAQIINLDKLEIAFNDGDSVCTKCLMEKGLIRKNNAKVKILGEGEITKKLNIEGVLISTSAKAAIEKAGGTVK